jgi:hypothetical protein
MSDLLAVLTGADDDADVLARIVAYHPDRVTVLLTDQGSELMAGDSDDAHALRDRMALVLNAIERETGATVVGLAGDRAQLDGWRFDRELASRLPVAA